MDSQLAMAARLRTVFILVKLASLVISGADLAGQSSRPVEIKAVVQAVIQGTTRVVIEFSGDFEYRSNRLHVPERVYFDVPEAKPRLGLLSSYPRQFESELISRIRVAERAPGVTRVVLDLLEEVDVSTAKLKNPARLLIDLRPASVPTPPIRTSIPPAGDTYPKPASGQGAALPLKPLNLELASVTEPVLEQTQSAPMPRHTLRLSPVSATPGSVAKVRLELDFPAGEEPLALQWELSYPSPKLGIEDGDLVAGSAANSAAKTFVCTGRVESAGEYVYRCVIAGGLKRVYNGVVALINFRVRSYAQPGPATVRVSDAFGVAIDGKKVPIQPNEADVTIR
jgi:hypothetical protein